MIPRPSPIFCPEMIAAILDGRKTQARRVARLFDPTGTYAAHDDDGCPMTADQYGDWRRDAPPHGGPGTIWYLREGLRRSDSGMVVYRQDGCPAWKDGKESQTWTWLRPTLPAMFMPAWAARYWLRVEALRVERLQDITEEDATAEGCYWRPSATACTEATNVAVFRQLWTRLNGKRPGCAWKDNPFVFVYAFTATEKP